MYNNNRDSSKFNCCAPFKLSFNLYALGLTGWYMQLPFRTRLCANCTYRRTLLRIFKKQLHPILS